jgi:catechol 2,3-dioxygenase-like lactoylglutathione lyase family enzyme
MSISTEQHTGSSLSSPATRDELAVPFHLSLNVADLGRSVDFFRRLFDLAPAKERSDYAKFEVAAPPLVLSLEPNSANAGDRLNHLGIRLPNSERLVEFQRRLEMAGIACQREDGVACCYARQTKFWITDPDGNLWEVYTIEEDLNCRGIEGLPLVERPQSNRRNSTAPAVWVHRLGDAIAARLFIESATVDQVLLQGSFNVPLAAEARQHLLGEVQRILKPGGQLTVHGLSADKPATDIGGRLPGPAAVVQFVPAVGDLVADLEAADFEGIHFSKLDDDACFTIDGRGLRETRIIAFRPSESSDRAACEILYKGPFRALEDDLGRTFHRGQWTFIDEAGWNRLRTSPLSDQFLFGTPPKAPSVERYE